MGTTASPDATTAPDREVLTWEGFGDASRELTQQIVDSGWIPDLIVAIARGGLIPAGAIAYAMDVKAIGTMNVEFYSGIGETLAERKAGKLNSILWLQLERGLAGLGPNADYSRLAVAYEPVWAIGTGQTASDEDIRMVHTLVRELLSSLLGSNGIGIQILYGGSVKPDNAKAILSLDNVDGLLVGGASLQAQSFADIVRADLA